MVLRDRSTRTRGECLFDRVKGSWADEKSPAVVVDRVVLDESRDKENLHIHRSRDPFWGLLLSSYTGRVIPVVV